MATKALACAVAAGMAAYVRSRKITFYTKKPLAVLVFDLDDTIYSRETGLMKYQRELNHKFMHEQLGVPMEETAALLTKWFKKENQSMASLRAAGFKFSTASYRECVRRGYEEHLKPSPEIKAVLDNLPQKKYVFSNGNHEHVLDSLKVMGLLDCFGGIYAEEYVEGHLKPREEGFWKVLKQIDADPSTVAFFEDNIKNLLWGKNWA